MLWFNIRYKSICSCIQAAINVARWAKWVKNSNLLERLDVPMIKEQIDASSRRKLLISFHGVEKTFLTLDSTDKTRMKKFYKECSKVPYLEHLEKLEIPSKHPDWFRLILTPVGVTRIPKTESELGHAISCICQALYGLHENGWAHNDIRWPNIVSYHGDWILIDCEFANKLGEALPSNLKIVDPAAASCCVGSDLYLLGKLLEYFHSARYGRAFDDFRGLLLSEKRFTLTSILSLKKNPWLALYWK